MPDQDPNEKRSVWRTILRVIIGIAAFTGVALILIVGLILGMCALK